MRGIANRATIATVHIQKMPRLTLIGLKMRDKSNPAEKENKSLSDPPVNSIPVSEYPTHISPNGPNIAYAPRPHPANATNTARAFVENLRINST